MPESAIEESGEARLSISSTIGHCMECHSPRTDGAHRSECARQKAARSFEGPVGRERVAQHHFAFRSPASAAGATRRIKRAITQGRRQGRQESCLPPMGFAWYARPEPSRTSTRIVAYLRTVPPLE